MKHLVYFMTCLALGAACIKKTEKNESLPVTEVSTTGPIIVHLNDTASFALSLDSVTLYREHYNSVAQEKLGQPAPVTAFTLRAEDLLDLLGLPQDTKVEYKFARIYLGLSYTNHFRIFLTPASGADLRKQHGGKDVISEGHYTKGEVNKAVQVFSGKYLMDFSSPCPNTCPD